MALRLSPHMTIMQNAAQKAAKRLLRDFTEVEQLQVSIKGPSDFVSQADIRAEATIRDELARARPGYSFLMEEGGAAGIELVGGDAAEDFADGVLNGVAVLGRGDLEVVGRVEGEPAVFGPGRGTAGGVVEVAELLGTEAGAATTTTVGEDVAATELLGTLVHWGTPLRVLRCEVMILHGLRVYFGTPGTKWLIGKGPAECRAFSMYFQNSRLGITHAQS